MDEDMAAALQLLKALADETRLRILSILSGGEQSVDQLAVALGLKPPTISHHLSKLRELDLVSMRTDGNSHLYSFRAEVLRQLNRDLLTPEKVAAFAGGDMGDAFDRKVLHDFLEDGRLKDIPASRKKRLVVLRWLVSQFSPGLHYPEAEINAVISRYHPDFATLRREMIMNRLMAREDGVYWRIDDAGANRRQEGSP